MTIRVVHSDAYDDEIETLDAVCFTVEEAFPLRVEPSAECWVALDGDTVIGYAVAYLIDGAAYLDRYGVHPDHAGRGVGKRLLRAWLTWARRRAPYAWTYTIPENAASINALAGAGLRAWRPTWALPGYCLWRRDL